MILVAAFVLLVFLYSLVSKRLEHTIITAPVVFTISGALVVLTLPVMHVDRKPFLLLAEVALVLILFSEATRINLHVLRRNPLPVRLLGIGMPLTILLGAIGGTLIFPDLSVCEVGILAAILAPTDAGLGEIVVSSTRVPERIRQTLSVEAGLNDGLSVPFLLFFIDLANVSTNTTGWVLMRFMVEQLGFGVLVGLVVGMSGGWLLGLARRKGWMAESLQQLGLVALPLLCVMGSEPIGASMFISAYIAGFAVQVGFKEAGEKSVEFTESWGRVFDFFVFFLFGMFVVRGASHLNISLVVYAVLSLTVVRILPVAISLIGTRLDVASVLFMGWFGPRGLASIVLGLVYLEQESNLAGETTITLAVMATVLLSIFSHGLSTLRGIDLYARKVATQINNHR